MTAPSAAALSARAKLTQRELQALRALIRAEVRAELAARPKKPARYRSPAELAGGARRMIDRLAVRAVGDDDALPLLGQLQRDLDAATQVAVTALRERVGYSWRDVGEALGVSRSWAQQKYGAKPGE